MIQSKKENILLIVTDQQRADTLSVYGGDICQTPHLDKLAEECIVMTNAYTSCPICTPARSSIQTGYYPFKTGMQTNIYNPGCQVQELYDEEGLLSRMLQKQGYNIGFTGKWHLGGGDQVYDEPWFLQHMGMEKVAFAEKEMGKITLPSSVGYQADDFPGHGGGGHRFPQYQAYLQENNLKHEVNKKGLYGEVVSPIESTMDYYLVERTLHYIKHFQEKEQPFFFALNFWGPHEPYYAPSSYLDLYRNLEIPPWPNFEDPLVNKPKIHNVKRAKKRTWESFANELKYYYGFMTAIDDQIGRLLKYLKDVGLYDQTTIIFMSDHGESLGCHAGLTDKAIFMYEETCRIPFMIKPSKKIKQRLDERFVGTCDVYATILELSGIEREKAETRDGHSLVPIINEEPSTDWPDCVVTECIGLGHVLHTQRMIRYRSYKYVFNVSDTDELYDLNSDPHEMNNFIGTSSYEQILIMMQQKLAEWMEKHNDKLMNSFKKIVG
jgi:arylsulfatase A-like enzyme